MKELTEYEKTALAYDLGGINIHYNDECPTDITDLISRYTLSLKYKIDWLHPKVTEIITTKNKSRKSCFVREKHVFPIYDNKGNQVKAWLQICNTTALWTTKVLFK